MVISSLFFRQFRQRLARLVTQTGIEIREHEASTETVVVTRAIPVIDAVLRRRCGDSAGARSMLDDLRGEVLVRLLRRLAPGINAPVGSLIVPVMVPRSDWPNSAMAESISRRVATQTRKTTSNFMVPL